MADADRRKRKTRACLSWRGAVSAISHHQTAAQQLNQKKL